MVVALLIHGSLHNIIIIMVHTLLNYGLLYYMVYCIILLTHGLQHYITKS